MALSGNQIKLIKQLHSKKFRSLRKEFIIEGEKLVAELLESDWEIVEIYAVEGVSWKWDVAVTTISEKDLSRISMLKNPNKVLAIVKQKNWEETYAANILMIDNVKDPGNLGTMIRTAEWFGFGMVICSTQTVELFNEKVLQSTMGSIFRMPVIYTELPSFLKKLHENNYHSIVTHLQGEMETPKKGHKSVLIMGSESHGVSQELTDLAMQKIKIEGSGDAESLNVAVATGILCYAMHA